GGGPGVGPCAVKAHLAPFLPGAQGNDVRTDGVGKGAPVSAATFGSASILPISWMYIAMMGAAGLKKATQVALLNANYVARRLAPHYETLYTGRNGLVAHECILDLRPLKDATGISAEDVAKRLIDFGFHAPTLSFPVAGTLMVEPTESESLHELDRFCDAMIQIREEIRAIEEGRMDREDNPLKHAPHTAVQVSASQWTHGYPRELAAFPLPSLKQQKYWPPVARVDNVYGDKNVFCSCVPVEAFAGEIEAFSEPAASRPGPRCLPGPDMDQIRPATVFPGEETDDRVQVMQGPGPVSGHCRRPRDAGNGAAGRHHVRHRGQRRPGQAPGPAHGHRFAHQPHRGRTGAADHDGDARGDRPAGHHLGRTAADGAQCRRQRVRQPGQQQRHRA